MQHKKIVLAGTLLSSVLFASAQEVAQTSTSQGDIDPNGSTTCVTVDTNLRYKMRDTSSDGDVSNLQDFLIANRYMQGTPTGYFGLGTFNAVKQFQKRSGLSPTGYVGPLTRAKIKEVSCNSDTQSAVLDQERSNNSSQKGFDDRNQGVMQKITDMMDKMRGTMASSSSLMAKVGSLMSEDDKALLKQKEDDVKAKKEAVKTLLDSFGGSTKSLTDEQKTAIKAKMDEAVSAEKLLMETRKTVMDKVSSSLSDSEKAELEKMKDVNRPKETLKFRNEQEGRQKMPQAPNGVQNNTLNQSSSQTEVR